MAGRCWSGGAPCGPRGHGREVAGPIGQAHRRRYRRGTVFAAIIVAFVGSRSIRSGILLARPADVALAIWAANRADGTQSSVGDHRAVPGHAAVLSALGSDVFINCRIKATRPVALHLPPRKSVTALIDNIVRYSRPRSRSRHAAVFAALGRVRHRKIGVLNLGVEGMMLRQARSRLRGRITTSGNLLAAARSRSDSRGRGDVGDFRCCSPLNLMANRVASGLAPALFGIGLSAFARQAAFESVSSSAADGKVPVRDSLLSHIPVLGPICSSGTFSSA